MSKTVPEGWKVKPLESILYRPLAYGVLKPGNNVRKGVPVVRIQDIRENRLNFDGLYRISKDLHEEFKRTKLNTGDLIISLVGTIGKTFVVPPALQDANVTRAFGVIGVEEGVSPDYVTQWLNSDSSQRWIQDQSQGNAQKVLNLGVLKQFPLQLPPLPEQQKIATILSSVDDVIEKIRAQIDKLKDLKTGMMQELLTKGIGPDGGPHTAFKDSPVGRIPVGWKVKPLETLVKATQPITYGIVQAGPHDEGGIPYIRVSDMTHRSLSANGMLRTSPEIAGRYKRSAVAENDIVYALRGVIGHVHIVPAELKGANLTQGTARISPGEQIAPRYLLWAMKSPYVRYQNELEAKGSTFKEVTLASLRKIQIAVPELKEQEIIAKTLDVVESKLFRIEDKLISLQSIKKALMQDLLTGKVRVNVEHPEPEFAS